MGSSETLGSRIFGTDFTVGCRDTQRHWVFLLSLRWVMELHFGGGASPLKWRLHHLYCWIEFCESATCGTVTSYSGKFWKHWTSRLKCISMFLTAWPLTPAETLWYLGMFTSGIQMGFPDAYLYTFLSLWHNCNCNSMLMDRKALGNMRVTSLDSADWWFSSMYSCFELLITH